MKPDLLPLSQTMMSARPRLIVCERQGLWTARLRQHLAGEVELRLALALADCLSELVTAPASLLVVEVTPANLPEIVELAGTLRRRFPHARLAVVAERKLADCEWLLREAGAVHFATSPAEAGQLPRLARRLAARAPKPRIGLAARVWLSLPWPEAAGTGQSDC